MGSSGCQRVVGAGDDDQRQIEQGLCFRVGHQERFVGKQERQVDDAGGQFLFQAEKGAPGKVEPDLWVPLAECFEDAWEIMGADGFGDSDRQGAVRLLPFGDL